MKGEMDTFEDIIVNRVRYLYFSELGFSVWVGGHREKNTLRT